jgi:hypothetical protein
MVLVTGWLIVDVNMDILHCLMKDDANWLHQWTLSNLSRCLLYLYLAEIGECAHIISYRILQQPTASR